MRLAVEEAGMVVVVVVVVVGNSNWVSGGLFLDVLFISGSCLRCPDPVPRGREGGVEKLVSTIAIAGWWGPALVL